MKKFILLFTFIVFYAVAFTLKSFAEDAPPDTVRTGIYITSIHDIDFKQKEYTINLWLWMKYKNKDFDFDKNLEIPQAKSFTKSFSTIDSSDGRVYILMKLQCIMKDSWKINKFPFDKQMLRLSFENSQFDSSAMVFAVDTVGERYGRFTINGWTINKDSFIISVRNQPYKTTFGDESLTKPYTAYSAYRVKIGVERDGAMTLFWKIFLGMYVSFFIAYVCFYIHADHIEARFGLSVGALFAAVGNKYVIDSSLPDSTSTTLVDTLHGLTMVSIFIVIASSIYSLKLCKQNKIKQGNRFDMITAQSLLLLYVVLNIYFIVQANVG